MESERERVEPKVPRGAHKLLQVWDRIGQLVEEIDLELLEEGNGDLGKKRLQVSAGTLKPEPAEVRKCDARRDWRTQQLPLDITAGEMRVEKDPENL